MLSTHILQEVQAVCDRIIIINKGKIVADEKTENITRVVENNRRFNVKICGPQKDVLDMLRDMQGISYAEVLAQKDGDANMYMIESEFGVDIRKKLFFSLAERGWAMVGLEALGMSLEDIFITVVDKTEEDKPAQSSRYARTATKRGKHTRTSLENDLADNLVKDAEQRREESGDED
jgi:ABC-2 type transport system ATP-binding protein